VPQLPQLPRPASSPCSRCSTKPWCSALSNHSPLACSRSLGLYRGLKEARGPEGCSAADLAARLGLVERYVAEWLRQQASAKLIRRGCLLAGLEVHAWHSHCRP
jgi:hypothetical protein